MDIFNKKHRLESLSNKQRHFVGKEIEDEIVSSLKSQGVQIEDTDIPKIDKIIIRDNRKYACVIKKRMNYSGSDILVELMRPYYGIDDKETCWGRDYLGKYDCNVSL